MSKTLIIITGATASGKTSVAAGVAQALGCDVISADSRQIYRDIPISTAAPTAAEMLGVRHHLVGVLPLEAYYSTARFEEDVERILADGWRSGNYMVMCGGSMMYIDAVTDGMDDLPDVSESVRQYVRRMYENNGAEGLLAQLEIVDPDYYEKVDRSNLKRVSHAIEVSLAAGRPYSTLLGKKQKKHDFEILKIAIERPREELFGRINRRVDEMVERGLIDEARRVYPKRSLNSLNTVGLKEVFAYFDGVMDLPTALDRIKKNTRVYAKKQLTWLGRDCVREALRIDAESAVHKILNLLGENN